MYNNSFGFLWQTTQWKKILNMFPFPLTLHLITLTNFFLQKLLWWRREITQKMDYPRIISPLDKNTKSEMGDPQNASFHLWTIRSWNFNSNPFKGLGGLDTNIWRYWYSIQLNSFLYTCQCYTTTNIIWTFKRLNIPPQRFLMSIAFLLDSVNFTWICVN